MQGSPSRNRDSQGEGRVLPQATAHQEHETPTQRLAEVNLDDNGHRLDHGAQVMGVGRYAPTAKEKTGGSWQCKHMRQG